MMSQRSTCDPKVASDLRALVERARRSGATRAEIADGVFIDAEWVPDGVL